MNSQIIDLLERMLKIQVPANATYVVFPFTLQPNQALQILDADPSRKVLIAGQDTASVSYQIWLGPVPGRSIITPPAAGTQPEILINRVTNFTPVPTNAISVYNFNAVVINSQLIVAT